MKAIELVDHILSYFILSFLFLFFASSFSVEALHLKRLSKENNTCSYAVRLRLIMLQIYLFQYWTTGKMQL